MTDKTSLHLTLYTRPGCCLCDQAHAIIAPILDAFGASLDVVNIDLHPALRQRFSHSVPVLEHGAHVLATFHVDPERLRDYLARASSPPHAA